MSLEHRTFVRRRERAAEGLEATALVSNWNDLARQVLLELRNEADLTQEEVAERISWRRTKMARLETRQPMSVGDFIVLARGIGKEPDKVLERVLARK